MRILSIVAVMVLLGCESQAQRDDLSSRREDRSQDSPGCSLKINDQKILTRDAILGSPVSMENEQYKVVFLLSTNRSVQSTFTNKITGQTMELDTLSNGILLANFQKKEPAESLQLELPANRVEIQSTTPSGDWMKLERSSKRGLSEAEIYWRLANAPETELNLSCDY